MIRHPWRFFIVSLLAAWAVDFLFWEKPVGISFLIWVTILLLGAVFLMHSEGVQFARQSFVLIGAILLLAAVGFLRQESFTRGFSILLTIGLIWLLTSTLQNGFWVRFRIIDYISAGFQAAVAALVRPLDLFKRDATLVDADTVQQKKAPRKLLPYLRGFLLALPILFILGGLLASADPIFSDWMKNLFSLFHVEWQGEYLFRLVYILVLAYLFIGIYLFALKPKRSMDRPDPDKSMIKGFLGWPETAVVLVSTNILFAVFLVVQFRYFFGGNANINETGFTYAEYARRGFNELLAVAVLSLLLYLGLSVVSNLTSKNSQAGFTGLSFLLVVQVMVILVSAFQRLLMYEEAYGFTRLRMVSHVFILWLGVLLAAVLILEILKRRGWFALAALISMFGFTVSLAIVNVDGQIVRRNIARSSLDELDTEYLKELSSDAVPAMADLYENAGDPKIRDLLGMQLACRKRILEETAIPWQAYTWSDTNARRILSGLGDSLTLYTTSERNGEWMVEKNGAVQKELGSPLRETGKI